MSFRMDLGRRTHHNMKTIKLLPSGSVMEQDDPLQNATPLKFVLSSTKEEDCGSRFRFPKDIK
jgi:hypothetical protein